MAENYILEKIRVGCQHQARIYLEKVGKFAGLPDQMIVVLRIPKKAIIIENDKLTGYHVLARESSPTMKKTYGWKLDIGIDGSIISQDYKAITYNIRS